MGDVVAMQLTKRSHKDVKSTIVSTWEPQLTFAHSPLHAEGVGDSVQLGGMVRWPQAHRRGRRPGAQLTVPARSRTERLMLEVVESR
jgi:hypothetical protein